MTKKDFNWLEKYNNIITHKRVLELGCGDGIDSRKLCHLAKSVTAMDIDISRAMHLPMQFNNLNVEKVDLASDFLQIEKTFDVVIASLVLHYFDWKTTLKIVQKIAETLTQNGALIGRVNSVNDVNFGAKGHDAIETGLFNVDGNPKRFFDKTMLQQLFATGFEIEFITEHVIDRYPLPKHVLEFVARKV